MALAVVAVRDGDMLGFDEGKLLGTIEGATDDGATIGSESFSTAVCVNMCIVESRMFIFVVSDNEIIVCHPMSYTSFILSPSPSCTIHTKKYITHHSPIKSSTHNDPNKLSYVKSLKTKVDIGRSPTPSPASLLISFE